MKISIIIPTYNRCEILSRSIDSALEQDYEFIEIIVSDNCSTDSTASILCKYNQNNKIILRRNEVNVGPIENVRICINDVSSGDYCIILSDDDYFINNKYISNCVNLINSNKNVVFVHSNCIIKNALTNIEYLQDRDIPSIVCGRDFFLKFQTEKFLHPMFCSVVFNRENAIRNKFFERRDIIGSDSLAWMLMCLDGNVGFIAEPSVVYLLHGQNTWKLSNFENIKTNTNCMRVAYQKALNTGKFNNKELVIWKKRLFNIEYNVLLNALKDGTSVSEIIFYLYKYLSYNKDMVFLFFSIKNLIHFFKLILRF